jgi:hypothetical protein
VASQSKTGCQGTTTSTGTNHDILVAGNVDSLGNASCGGQQAKQTRKNHNEKKEYE